jgi:hypothetical protein
MAVVIVAFISSVRRHGSFKSLKYASDFNVIIGGTLDPKRVSNAASPRDRLCPFASMTAIS